MPENSPEISVIICTYNTKEISLKCLANLKASIDFLGKPVEVVVVENGNDGTGGAVKKLYPWVKVIKPKENLGYSRGNNLGIGQSNQNSKYYLLLNSDAIVSGDSLKNAIDFMEEHTDCDVLGCRLNFEDGHLQPSAGFLPNPANITLWMVGLDRLSPKPVHPKNKKFFESSKKVGWVMGAFLFMRRKVIDVTRGLDESFFMYMEEVEWCRRMQDSGFSIWYTPSFEITHLDKASSNFNLEKPLTLEIQGLKYYVKRYFPNYSFMLNLISRLGILMRYIIFGLSGDKKRSDIYLDILKNI